MGYNTKTWIPEREQKTTPEKYFVRNLKKTKS